MQNVLEMLIIHNENDNDNDNECFILTYELIKQIIYSTGTMIDQYSHSQGNYIMTYISLACNYLKMYLKIIVVINSLCFKYCWKLIYEIFKKKKTLIAKSNFIDYN